MVTHESFGLVVVESFSQGTSAFMHDPGALPELIDQLKAGRGMNQDAVA